jgi:hypothetical protein
MNSRRRHDDCCNKIIQKYIKQSTEMIGKKYSDSNSNSNISDPDTLCLTCKAYLWPKKEGYRHIDKGMTCNVM